jgi:hypothetical protein
MTTDNFLLLDIVSAHFFLLGLFFYGQYVQILLHGHVTKRWRVLLFLIYVPLLIGQIYLTLPFLHTILDDSSPALVVLSYALILSYATSRIPKAALKRRDAMLNEKTVLVQKAKALQTKEDSASS